MSTAAPPDAAVLSAARAELAARDPALAVVDRAVAPFAWRSERAGFAGLVRMIVGQQVSTTSADATWARLLAQVGEATPGALAALTDEAYRACGFSGQKLRYARGVAEAELEGRLGLDTLHRLSDDEALARLTAEKGVGRWTAESYLMMSEGRLDVFPGGDIAVQEAIRWLDRLPVRPSAAEAYGRAEVWRPLRAVATHLLWAWYMAVKAGAMAHPLSEAETR